MQAYVCFLEAEPDKHPVVIINCWIGKSGHAEIVGAFTCAGRGGAYGRSDLRQIALRLFRTSCYVFIYSTSFAFCHGGVLSLSRTQIVIQESLYCGQQPPVLFVEGGLRC